MTDRAPIPPEAFDDALDRLDRDSLAAFVGRLEAAAGRTVEVDPPVVTLGDDDRERVLVAPDSLDPGAIRAEYSDSIPDRTRPEEDDPTPDVVVVPGSASTADVDIPVRTAADLRTRLLYAVPPAAAESIAEEWLAVPARSARYTAERAAETAADERAGGAGIAGGDGIRTGAARGDENRTGTTGDDHAESDSNPGDREPGTSQPDGEQESPTPAVGEASVAGDPSRDDGMVSDDSAQRDERPGAAATRSAAGLAVVAVLVAMILAVTGGVVYAAELSPEGDAGAFAAPTSVDAGGINADLRRRLRNPTTASAAGTTSTPMPGESHGAGTGPTGDDGEGDRAVRPVPTCERSFLHVVQIQMNALKYNNNTTNDGIRTVRRFASPRNRRAIRTFDEFVRILERPTYSPMLSYDSVQYTPLRSSGDFAQVQVITREGGNTTGMYYFRLRKIDGGEYDGCWLTDAVVSIPETNEFSGRVGGRSTGSINGTS